MPRCREAQRNEEDLEREGTLFLSTSWGFVFFSSFLSLHAGTPSWTAAAAG